MSQPPNITAGHQLAIYFETNEVIPAYRVLSFLAALDQIAFETGVLGPGYVIEIEAAGRGTFWTVLNSVASVGGGFGSMGALAFMLIKEWAKDSGTVARTTAELMIDGAVARLSISSLDTGTVDVLREMMPMVALIERAAAANATGDIASPGIGGAISSAPIGAAPIGGSIPLPTAIGAASGLSRPTGNYLPPRGDNVVFDFGGNPAKGQLHRDVAETVRRVSASDDGTLVAGPIPPETGRELPVVVGQNRVVNFAHSTSEARGHVLRLDDIPVAFEVMNIERGGTATATQGAPPSG